MYPNNEPQKVEFEEFRQPSQSFQTPTPKITEWVMKHSGGMIKDEKQANYVLIGFVVVAIVLTFILLSNSSTSSRSQKLTPEEQSEMLLKIMPPDGPPVTY